MAGRQLGDAAKDRPRMRHVLIGQVLVQRQRVDLPGHVRHLQQGLQLAGEQQPARLVTIDQRLFSQPIPGQQQLLPLGVPDGQGEHAVQMCQQLGPLVFVQVDEHFRVALGAELVAGLFEPAPQVAEIVDFAVEHDPHGAVFVRKRLFSAGQVDDGQAPMPKGHAGWAFHTGNIAAFAIRPAMAQNVDHPLKRCRLHGLTGVVPDRTGDAAHEGLEIRGQGSGIRGQGSGVRDQGSVARGSEMGNASWPDRAIAGSALNYDSYVTYLILL